MKKVFTKERLKQKEQVMEQLVVRLYRGLGTSLARRLAGTKITPNQVTTFAALFVVIAGVFFTTGGHFDAVIASCILFFSLVLDFTDGTLARMRNQTSMFGDWFDAMVDEMREVVITVGLCAGLYRNTPSLTIWFLGLIILTSDRLIFRTTNKLYKVLPYDEAEIGRQVQKTFSGSLFFRVSKEFMSVRLLKYTVLPFFAVFDRLSAYMVFAAGYGIVLCLAFLAYSVFKLKKEEKRRRQ